MPRNRGLGRVRRSPGTVTHPFNRRTFATIDLVKSDTQLGKKRGARFLPRSGLRLALTLLDGGVSLLGRRDFLAQLGDRRVHRDDFRSRHPDPAFGRSFHPGDRHAKAARWARKSMRMAERSRKAGSCFTTYRLPARFFRCMCRMSRRDQAKCPTPPSSFSPTPRLFP